MTNNSLKTTVIQTPETSFISNIPEIMGKTLVWCY